MDDKTSLYDVSVIKRKLIATTLNEVFDKAPNMIDDLIYKGIDYIMNHYNG